MVSCIRGKYIYICIGTVLLLVLVLLYNMHIHIPYVQVTLRRGIDEMVVDGGGHFSPAVIDGVHTCLYYSRPIQHIAVPRVIQYNTYTDILRPLIDTL